MKSGDAIRTGPFSVHVQSDDPTALKLIDRCYARPDRPRPIVHDFYVNLQLPRGPRRLIRPKIQFRTDAVTPFQPFPLDHAFAMFEWGLNWCIAMQAHQFLMLHSAVVEKDGLALIMPATPGSGKSTLCAALMLSGWRLLSDEFGLIRPLDPELMLHPMPRPVPLKNASIDVIRRFSETAELGPIFPKTRKGDVAHLFASQESRQRMDETARPGWFLFPRYRGAAKTLIERLSEAWTFMKISGNSFNYKLQGGRGFQAVVSLVDRCPAFSIEYGDLDDAIERIDKLHRQIVENRTAS